jgi:nicotinate-nucleotide adenylyltransferase
VAIKKIGIYGGTFNPVHYGHLRTAEDVFESYSLDRIVFIPSGITPFDKPDLEGPVYRYKMVEAAIAGNDHFRISDIEVNAPDKSYTVDTLRKLKNKYGESDLFFILGADAFLDLPKWKEPHEIVKLANLIVISRPGYRFAGLAPSPYMKGISGDILKELDKGERKQIAFDISEKMKGHLCNVTALNISASSIRELIASGREIKYLLPDSVKSYIILNKLYLK